MLTCSHHWKIYTTKKFTGGLILCFWKTGQHPRDIPAPVGYKAAKGFASALENKQDDFYTIIFIRKDLEDQLTPRTFEETL